MLFSFSSYLFAQALVPLNSEEGGKMLASSISQGYAKQFLSEVRYFTYQENVYFCNVATASIVLNTLQVMAPNDENFGDYKLFTQDNILTTSVAKKMGITRQYIFAKGLTLEEETRLLNAFPTVEAKAYSSRYITEAQAKTLIVNALKSDQQFVIVNILRSQMDQQGQGHFSLISAYDKSSDSVLFMDVASYKYGPTWIPLKTLYRAMATKDGDIYRGFILVNRTFKKSTEKSHEN
jgi:hypothetical protein